MIILPHRGLWKNLSDRNSLAALSRAFDSGNGAETDLRGLQRDIIVSHDLPKGDEPTFEEVLRLMAGRNLPLALNIKADGLAAQVKALLEKYGHSNYFVFDMSIPDMIDYLRRDMAVFTGLSDVQPSPVLLEKAAGVWLDSFESDWFGVTEVNALLSVGKRVCVVSPDLHNRDVAGQWAKLKAVQNLGGGSLMLCTDRVREAEAYFHD